MNKSTTLAILATLVLAVAACAGNPPQQTSDNALAAPADGNGIYGHWMVPISFPD